MLRLLPALSTNNGNLHSATYNNGGPRYPVFLTFNQRYGYDNVNRTNSVSDSGGWSRTFQTDAYGNTWVKSNSGVPLAGNTPTASVYTAANQINGASYDASGNQTVVNGNTLAYDAENRQISETDGVTHAVETYNYDGDGHRVSKTGPGGTTVYVYDVLGQLAAEYSTATNTPVCTTSYLVWDHLGSTGW